MKNQRILKLAAFVGIGFISIAAVAIGFLPEGPSPFSFEVERYETNVNEIVAFVQMENISERIAQYECEPGSQRLRYTYSYPGTNWISPSPGNAEFLYPGQKIVAEIPLPSSAPVSVGVMVRIAPPMNLGNPVTRFITNLRFTLRGKTAFRPHYLPEPLLQSGSK